jgi:hypothetical protein
MLSGLFLIQIVELIKQCIDFPVGKEDAGFKL